MEVCSRWYGRAERWAGRNEQGWAVSYLLFHSSMGSKSFANLLTMNGHLDLSHCGPRAPAALLTC